MFALEKIKKARTGLVLDAPFWGALSCRLKLVEDASCETAWTDGKTIGYNPAYIDELTLQQVKGLLGHETAHCAFQHHQRRDSRDAHDWNRATDYTINGILQAEGFELPPGALIDAQFDGLSSEQVFTRLTAGPEPKPQQDNPAPESGDENPQDEGETPTDQPQGDSSDDSDDSDAPDASGDDGSESGDTEPENDGNGDTDAPGDAPGDAPQSSDPGKCGEVRDAPPEEGEPEDWAQAVQEAQNYANACGKMGEGAARAVEDILAPVVDWRDRLRDFIETTAKQDYTWGTPNRRHVHAGLFLPGCESEELPPLAVCIDTSGSINQSALDQFSGELAAILADYPGTRCRVIYCDYSVQATQDVSADDCELTPAGGGGTAFSPAFEAVDQWTDEEGETPAAIIYFTDLMCHDFPEVSPQAPVLWLEWAIPGYGHYDNDPPFGEVVKM